MALSEELEVLKEVARSLDEAGIAYMVTGSIAANFYTVPRMTRDIDIVVELSDRDVDRFIGIFEKDFYLEPETIEAEVRKKGMFNLIHNEHVIKIDFVVRKESEYRRKEFSRKRKVSVDDQDIYVVSPEDLILSKLDWAKEGEAVKDTSPAMERKFRDMLLKRSQAERLKMGCSMHATAQALVRASMLEEDPSASPATLRKALFLRFYAHDFDAATRKRIFRRLETR